METLSALLADAEARLVAAVADRHSPMHTPVVGTRDGELRIMVLRAVSAGLTSLRFHTDLRAPKVAAVREHGWATVLAYDSAARVQLRLSGVARIQADDALADAAWDSAATFSRRCYLAEAGPGTPRESAGSGLPEAVVARRPTEAETREGRRNFAVLLIEPDRLDWLQLDASGGRRAQFARHETEWRGTWVVP